MLSQTQLHKLLAYALAAFGVFTLLYTTRMIVRQYNPVLYMDQWALIDDLTKANGHITLERLWAQHNEHRIPFTRLASYIDLFYFGGRNVLLLILIYCTQAAHAVLWIFLLRRWGPKDSSLQLSLAALCTFAMFSPIQVENFVWAFQTQFVQVGLFAALTFALLIEYTIAGRRWLLIAALVSACVTELSLSSGMFVWPVLMVAGYGLRLKRNDMLWLGGVAMAAIGVYFYGFQLVAHHADPFESMRHPVTVIRFVLSYFAFSWDPNLPNPSEWPSFFEWIALAAIGWALVQSARMLVFARERRTPLETFCCVNILFVLISASVTALGRLGVGAVPALQSRYQTVALVFWAAIGILVALRISKLPVSAQNWAQAGLLVLLLSQATRFDSANVNARARKDLSAEGYAALVLNTNNLTAIEHLYPDPAAVIPWFAFLHERHLDLDPAFIVEAMQQAKGRGNTEPHLEGFTLASRSRCAGYFDEIHVTGGVIGASGWAWDTQTGTTPDRIVLATEDGTPVSDAAIDTPRPAVRQLNPSISKVNVGWKATLNAMPGRTIRAFGILGPKTACLLANEFAVPAK